MITQSEKDMRKLIRDILKRENLKCVSTVSLLSGFKIKIRFVYNNYFDTSKDIEKKVRSLFYKMKEKTNKGWEEWSFDIFYDDSQSYKSPYPSVDLRITHSEYSHIFQS